MVWSRVWGAAEAPGAGFWGAGGLPSPRKPKPLPWSLRAGEMPGSDLVQDILQLPHQSIIPWHAPMQKPWIQILDPPPSREPLPGARGS